ncbi:hypothetical protein HMPREF1246_1710 [Acidaminococcus sp. BV3L6]|uniref:Uncharacterized protein n=1 Tax=Acidaminococcus intestini (strain RyC-MR95) TaxID=568816 RepID=G4Q709_ACIIR|nr:hypothetical protein Acin_2299 [Acidaminococcus intestini RyC-MR95]ERL16068.1 hypothetical protein HMPREF1246_1710 [Acidaminococcus sp. BV3L6]
MWNQTFRSLIFLKDEMSSNHLITPVLLSSGFTLETANPVPPYQGGEPKAT